LEGETRSTRSAAGRGELACASAAERERDPPFKEERLVRRIRRRVVLSQRQGWVDEDAKGFTGTQKHQTSRATETFLAQLIGEGKGKEGKENNTKNEGLVMVFLEVGLGGGGWGEGGPRGKTIATERGDSLEHLKT